MLKITIELISAADERWHREKWEAELFNTAKNPQHPARGDYILNIVRKGGGPIWKQGAVKNFPRQKLGPWDLLYRALKDAVGDRNE